MAASAYASNSTGFFGHPTGLLALFIVEMWERFSFFGMRMLLVLYLKQAVDHQTNPGRGWEEGQANMLYGWYTGLAYLLPLFGGFLADRLLGTHRSVVTGSLLMALGHVALGLSGIGELATSHLGMSIFITGLALIIIGTGYFKPSMSVMVGQLYKNDDPRRDGAYTIFYMGVNLGAFICPFVCGTLGESVGWHWGFGSAAIGMVLGLACYIALRPVLLQGVGDPPGGRANFAPGFLLVSVLLAGLVGLLYHQGGFAWFAKQISELWNLEVAGTTAGRILAPSALAAVLGLAVWFISIQQGSADRGKVTAIFLFMLFNAFFWIAFEQAGSTLNVFAKDYTDRNLFGFEIPATWLQTVNAGLILLLAPFFVILWTFLGQRGQDPSQAIKIGLGLLFLGIGYGFIVMGAVQANHHGKAGMVWLVTMYTFHTVGELCLSPTGLSFVTRTAPVRYQSLVTGIWYVSSAMAYLGGGLVASYVKDIEKGVIKLPWSEWIELGGRADFFMIFVVSSLGAGLMVLILSPLLNRLLGR